MFTFTFTYVYEWMAHIISAYSVHCSFSVYKMIEIGFSSFTDHIINQSTTIF